ncbi:hypothetical protein HDV02_006267 [Globomyces sp. JEL0801]|nr:hypothetical protein HDV02_006267 [Globomyces sp. JEL0801]
MKPTKSKRKKKCDGGLPECNACILFRSKARGPVPECVYLLKKDQKYFIQSFIGSRLNERKENLKEKLLKLEKQVQILEKYTIPSSDYEMSRTFSDETFSVNFNLDSDSHIYSSPLNFKIPFFGFETVEMSSEAIAVVFDDLQDSLFSACALFSIGKREEGYDRWYETIVRGRLLGFFYQGTFSFPSKYPQVPLPRLDYQSSLSNSDRLKYESLWNASLRLDILEMFTHEQPFIMNDSRQSHMNLPLHFPRFSSKTNQEGSIVYNFFQVMMTLENQEGFQDMFQFESDHIFYARYILYLETINTTSNLYSTLEYENIIMNLHLNVLSLYQILGSNSIYESLTFFDDQQVKNPPAVHNHKIETILGEEGRLMMFSVLHFAAIKLGIHLKFPLQPQFEKKHITFTSYDILLRCIRAIRYCTLLAEQVESSNISMLIYTSKGKVNLFAEALSIGCMYDVSRSCLLGLGLNNDYTNEKKEAESIIRDVIYPRISQLGWDWPMARFFAYKLQCNLQS